MSLPDGAHPAAVFRELSVSTRPPWSDVTSAGTFRREPGGRSDLHFHDCDEYWLVRSGRARILVGEETFEVGPGDIVCIEAGELHDVLATDGPFEAFWFEGATPPGGRIGHLHRTPEEAAGHTVELLASADD